MKKKTWLRIISQYLCFVDLHRSGFVLRSLLLRATAGNVVMWSSVECRTFSATACIPCSVRVITMSSVSRSTDVGQPSSENPLVAAARRYCKSSWTFVTTKTLLMGSYYCIPPLTFAMIFPISSPFLVSPNKDMAVTIVMNFDPPLHLNE